ncbi:hypothetical protein [Leptospira tipperaryensis]|uniref:hypothetical protein n=1 Tax=Leptospira tipperaryensis TaxID=2564040 RepID=UPI0012EADF57|nr:hypothetical protein [Leptospira tipperaryensis]
MSAEENEIAEASEISIHQSEVDRVLSSPLSKNLDLDQEDFFVSKKNRIALFQKQKSRPSKIQTSSQAELSGSHFESLSAGFKGCPDSSFTKDSNFHFIFLSLSSVRILNSNSILNQEDAANSLLKNGSMNEGQWTVYADAKCPLFTFLNLWENSCSSEKPFLSQSHFQFSRNFAAFAGFYPGDRFQKTAFGFHSAGHRDLRDVLAFGDFAQDAKLKEKRAAAFFSTRSFATGTRENLHSFLGAEILLWNQGEMNKILIQPGRAISSSWNEGTPMNFFVHSSRKGMNLSSSILKNSPFDSLVG